ncbi:MAG: hypothetical protein WAW41_01585 [Methylobacter sp.]
MTEYIGNDYEAIFAGLLQATTLSAFVHPDDVPDRAPPTDHIDVPLSADIPEHIFTLVHLSAERASNCHFSCIDGNGHIKTPHPIFQIQLKNRSTIWQSINKKMRSLVFYRTQPASVNPFCKHRHKNRPSCLGNLCITI